MFGFANLLHHDQSEVVVKGDYHLVLLRSQPQGLHVVLSKIQKKGEGETERVTKGGGGIGLKEFQGEDKYPSPPISPVRATNA